ncbi:phosphotransferase family protein [Flavisphingomonas formosensis]|uniref:phosphotransferase family protein n=1 Tax=Flavisphingomonas formosensis TaxID=861534 RepID=UPI0012F8BCF3|nr:phosphotransferase family protein [Sphingomonas formosensis]
MTDPLLGEKLRSILTALRADLKPELQAGNARLRCELIEMLLARLSIEVEEEAGPAAGVEAERDWRNAHEARIAAVLAAPVAATGSGSELEIPAAVFSAWFAGRDAGIEIARVTTVPGGRSKGTILLDCVDGRQLVIRRDFAAAVTGTSVSDEFPVIRAVHGQGLRVPEPLWLESSPDAIGGRFIVFERLRGKAMGTLFASDASPAFCRDFAAELARLHRLDIDALGIADALTYGREDHPVRAHLESYERRYRSGMAPVPLIDAAFAWLHERLPHIGNERRLVHGDAGLHNTLGDDDRLTGLLDWEFAHAGDPAEDLAYCRFLVSRVLPWEEFMAAYRGAGGPEVSDARLSFFTVWRTLLLSVLTGFARTSYDKDVDRDLRIAAIGYNTFPKQLRDLANDLATEMNA